MPWDPLAPVAGLVDRSGTGAPVVAPFGGASFGDVGPGAGVGAAEQINAAINAATSSSTSLPAAGDAITRPLLQLHPVDDETVLQAFGHGFRTLLVYNPLAARINVNWGYNDVPPVEDPQITSTSQLLLPGNSLAAFPIPTDATSLRATVLYPGAVPAADQQYGATLYVTTDVLPVFVGPLQ